jgi:hypothetical protein
MYVGNKYVGPESPEEVAAIERERRETGGKVVIFR